MQECTGKCTGKCSVLPSGSAKGDEPFQTINKYFARTLLGRIRGVREINLESVNKTRYKRYRTNFIS